MNKNSENFVNELNETTDKNGLPEYILGYKIEREYGDKNIEDCIRDIVITACNIARNI